MLGFFCLDFLAWLKKVVDLEAPSVSMMLRFLFDPNGLTVLWFWVQRLSKVGQRFCSRRWTRSGSNFWLYISRFMVSACRFLKDATFWIAYRLSWDPRLRSWSWNSAFQRWHFKKELKHGLTNVIQMTNVVLPEDSHETNKNHTTRH